MAQAATSTVVVSSGSPSVVGQSVTFTATVAVSLLGLALFLFRGKAGLNIDFVGGTAYGGRLTKPLTIEELRRLLDKDRQEVALKVQSVTRKQDDGRLFELVVSDGSTATVSLPNPAKGDNAAAQEANIKERASQLPDWSVEQIFVTDPENTRGGSASRFFTIRSTEKAPNLKQHAVSRM